MANPIYNIGRNNVLDLSNIVPILTLSESEHSMNCQTEIDTGIGSGEINVTAMDFSTPQ